MLKLIVGIVIGYFQKVVILKSKYHENEPHFFINFYFIFCEYH